jgi:hypothetical protein
VVEHDIGDSECREFAESQAGQHEGAIHQRSLKAEPFELRARLRTQVRAVLAATPSAIELQRLRERTTTRCIEQAFEFLRCERARLLVDVDPGGGVSGQM